MGQAAEKLEEYDNESEGYDTCLERAEQPDLIVHSAKYERIRTKVVQSEFAIKMKDTQGRLIGYLLDESEYALLKELERLVNDPNLLLEFLKSKSDEDLLILEDIFEK